MVVLELGVEDFAEAPFLVQVASVDGGLPVVARLGHHVAQSGALLEIAKETGLLEGHHGRHGRDNVESALHAHGNVTEVVRRAAEHSYRVQVLGPAEHLLQRVVYGVAPIRSAKPVASIGPQVGHRCDRAVRVLVPIELRAEASPNHSDTNLAGPWGLSR